MNDQTVRGVVYVMTNESMPGLVKIGMTTRGSIRRAEELYQTGVPTPFKVAAEFRSVDCRKLEATVHSALIECRVSTSREFFKISFEDACDCIRDLEGEQLSELLNWVRPHEVLVPFEAMVDPGDMMRLADGLGVSVDVLSMVMSDLTVEELAEAVSDRCTVVDAPVMQ